MDKIILFSTVECPSVCDTAVPFCTRRRKCTYFRTIVDLRFCVAATRSVRFTARPLTTYLNALPTWQHGAGLVDKHSRCTVKNVSWCSITSRPYVSSPVRPVCWLDFHAGQTRSLFFPAQPVPMTWLSCRPGLCSYLREKVLTSWEELSRAMCGTPMIISYFVARDKGKCGKRFQERERLYRLCCVYVSQD